ncbi:hypothetical protein EJ02DRAFT_269522 [Clathrospora elynae]|uniref:Uncharacterized protein n=1 Tax=Clathrospora elynae TaxID=706981 RepID=A0A6A5SK83_9PLEO|nr:hypothetical protein EJ02DRAFT_269522 [Clathrospora elynae]
MSSFRIEGTRCTMNEALALYRHDDELLHATTDNSFFFFLCFPNRVHINLKIKPKLPHTPELARTRLSTTRLVCRYRTRGTSSTSSQWLHWVAVGNFFDAGKHRAPHPTHRRSGLLASNNSAAPILRTSSRTTQPHALFTSHLLSTVALLLKPEAGRVVDLDIRHTTYPLNRFKPRDPHPTTILRGRTDARGTSPILSLHRRAFSHANPLSWARVQSGREGLSHVHGTRVRRPHAETLFQCAEELYS